MKMSRDEAVESAMSAALHYLSFKARTVFEVREYLLRKELAESTVMVTLARLDELGYLNDEQYAKQFIDSRTRARHQPISRLRYDLLKRGIDKEIVEESLQALEPSHNREMALAEARRVMGRYRGKPAAEADRKALASLMRRGFAYEDAVAAVREVSLERDQADPDFL
jgi:regulatory protein